ncbi:MAG: DUF1802 family protein [Candidatus Obscuribacterales bacterium]|nr:DUF1802 family protein [Candidatus Obscuribacterales bacterium]MBY0552053.1 DUF1802 family protein [Candidatus Obscuribacterales bacterium]
METERGIKEWSAVIEALGSGKQTILIRKRPPQYADMLLFPTFNYYQKNVSTPEIFDAQFQSQHVEAARRSAVATMKQAHEDMLADINFYAHVERIIEVTDKKVLDQLKKHYIWAPGHVKAYADSAIEGRLHVMLLRVYKLSQVARAGRSGGGVPDFYKHHEKVSLKGAKAVLSDDEFNKEMDSILSITGAKVHA